MKRILFVLMISTLAFLTFSCTENGRAKNWGGNATMNLPCNQKLINVTWKDSDLWYLTRTMTANDVAETYTFSEESSFGIMEGTYTIVESTR